ncbi:MAG: hypothetical protein AAFR04_05050 [Pseudomonadota bacterium]
MLNDDAPRGWLGRVLARVPEGSVLRVLFFGLLASSGYVFATDYVALRALDEKVPEEPGLQRSAPVTMQPPSQRDQIRPYLPRSRPMRPRGGKVRLPGYTRTPDNKRLRGPMTFRLGSNGKASAVGRINQGAYRAFVRFLEEADGPVRSIAFHSPGGSVSDALRIGRLIRKRKMTTVVPQNAYCASSCPLAFSGGVERRAGRKVWIGVHQVFTLPSTVGSIQEGLAQGQRISAACQRHLSKMGVDAQVWVHAMGTPKDQLYVFTRKQLKRYKLVTAFASRT